MCTLIKKMYKRNEYAVNKRVHILIYLLSMNTWKTWKRPRTWNIYLSLWPWNILIQFYQRQTHLR